MKRSKTLVLAAALGAILSTPSYALDRNVREAINTLKQSYTRINNDFIRTYRNFRNQGSSLEVRIDQSGFDRLGDPKVQTFLQLLNLVEVAHPLTFPRMHTCEW